MQSSRRGSPSLTRLLYSHLLTFLFGSLIAASAQAGTPLSKTQIVMGFNPAESSEVVESNGKKLAEVFKARAGIDVKVFIASDYTALIEALRSGEIDIAWLPSFSYIKAEEIAKSHILLKVVRKGKPFLWSAIITRSDKPYSKIEDLKGKNIAWVDPSSATGHIVPKAELMRKKGIDPDTFFGKQIFAGSHDAVVLSIINGTVDAGATFANDAKATDASWTRFLKDPVEQKKIKVLYISEPIPGDTVTASDNLATHNKDVMDLTVKTLRGMTKDPEGKKVLYSLYQIDDLIPAKPSEYESLKAAAKLLHLN